MNAATDAEMPKRFTTPVILALASLVPIWAACLFFIFLGYFYGSDHFTLDIYRWFLIGVLVLTYAAFHCVRNESYSGFVGVVAYLMLIFALLTSIFFVGLLILPSAVLMILAASSMSDD